MIISRQFHGTSLANADGILAEGVRKTPGTLGHGFYTTPDVEQAKDYETTFRDDRPDSVTVNLPGRALISGDVVARSPATYRSERDARNHALHLGLNGLHQLGDYLHRSGHDVVTVAGTTVSFEPDSFRPKELQVDDDGVWTNLR